MENTLAVNDQRHLVLPDSCLFAPTELQIGTSLSQNEFSRLGKALASVDHASDLWACDYALAGQKRWGPEGLQLASTATRLSVGYLKVSARIAERFDPARRYASMTREHYRGICCFPVEFTDKWLPTVVEMGFSARTLRALACEAFGSDPKAGYSKNKKRLVMLPETLWARLRESSPIPKTAIFIEQILFDFVHNSTPEQQARIAAALSTRDADKVRTRRNKPKAGSSQSRGIIAQMTTTCYGRNTRFKDGSVAKEAADQYSKEHGYTVEPCWCETCKSHHIRPVPLS
jgi:hypothetical protein